MNSTRRQWITHITTVGKIRLEGNPLQSSSSAHVLITDLPLIYQFIINNSWKLWAECLFNMKRWSESEIFLGDKLISFHLVELKIRLQEQYITLAPAPRGLGRGPDGNQTQYLMLRTQWSQEQDHWAPQRLQLLKPWVWVSFICDIFPHGHVVLSSVMKFHSFIQL